MPNKCTGQLDDDVNNTEKIHFIIDFRSRSTACGRSILDKECSTKFGRVFWTTIEKDITCRNCLRGNEAERKQQDGK